MDDKNCVDEQKKKQKNWGPGGGLYRGTKVSVKTLNKIIAVLLVVLVSVIIYLASTSHYNVSFETNGGEILNTYQCKYGEYVNTTNPTKTGYNFAGWFQDKDLTKPWNLLENKVQESITLYAAWTPSLIHVMFDLDGGYFNELSNISAKDIAFNNLYGELPIPQKDGYTFIGWQYNGTMIKSDTRVSMNGEHTLKAIWQSI